MKGIIQTSYGMFEVHSAVFENKENKNGVIQLVSNEGIKVFKNDKLVMVDKQIKWWNKDAITQKLEENKAKVTEILSRH